MGKSSVLTGHVDNKCCHGGPRHTLVKDNTVPPVHEVPWWSHDKALDLCLLLLLLFLCVFVFAFVLAYFQ